MPADEDELRSLAARAGGLMIKGVAYLPIERAPGDEERRAAGITGKTVKSTANAAPGNRRARRRAEALARRAP